MPTIESTNNLKISIGSLLNLYPEAFLVQGERDCGLEDVTGFKKIKPKSLAYLKNKSFWKRFLEAIGRGEDASSLSLVIDEKLHKEIATEVSGLVQVIITVPNVEKALCLFSKPFYNKFISFEDSQTRENSGRISEKADISPLAFIGPNVDIDDDVKIMAGVQILGDTKIGKGAILFPNVVIYPRTEIGEYCRIHGNTTIGADGFGYNFIDGKHLKIWHFGGVKIANHVEIGANSCVDGGSFEPTTIGEGTRIDNHVQIGHNCEVGRHVVICGQSALAGSCILGDYVALGGKSGLGPSVSLGMGSQLAGGGLVNRNWPDGSTLGGYPAFEIKNWLRSIAKFKKLGERKSSS